LTFFIFHPRLWFSFIVSCSSIYMTLNLSFISSISLL
jgi:hypothetical protein